MQYLKAGDCTLVEMELGVSYFDLKLLEVACQLARLATRNLPEEKEERGGNKKKFQSCLESVYRTQILPAGPKMGKLEG